MAMTHRAMAQAIGLTAGQVCKLAKKGMPLDSPESAAAWRNRHIGAHTSRPASPPPKPAPLIEEDPEAKHVEELANLPFEEITNTENCRDALQESRDARRFAWKKVKDLDATGQLEDSRKWMQTHQQMLLRQGNLEEQFRNLIERDGETISYRDADTRYRSFLNDIRVICMAMPSSLASKVNPTDPPHAQKIMEEWRNDVLFKTLKAKGGEA
jgi:hypothetical protein